MIIDKPKAVAPLRTLWKQAFGDTDQFLDAFFSCGFSPDRCRQLTIDGTVAAVLYWFDCSFSGKKIAYFYGVATDKAYRGQGLCRKLMEETHRHLQGLGYTGALLVPGSEDLFRLYEKLGYRTCSSVREFRCKAADAVQLKIINRNEYFLLRKNYLPEGSVEPEGSMLTFLNEQYSYYAGENFVLCAAAAGDTLMATEFLGNPSAAPGVVGAFGKKQGCFRTFGNDKPFAMYYPLTTDLDQPSYFALALD